LNNNGVLTILVEKGIFLVFLSLWAIQMMRDVRQLNRAMVIKEGRRNGTTVRFKCFPY
jgi:hypothetical protein